MSITAVIIDDEAHCIKTLNHLLKKHCGEVTIIGTANNAMEGRTMIESLQPQLVFLDVQMPYQSGIDMLSQMTNIPCSVIFTTAYDAFALKAIKLNALDYLLKPIDAAELKAAVEKYQQLPLPTTKAQAAGTAAQIKNKVSDMLAIASSQGLEFLKIPEIILLEADDAYTHIYTKDGSKKTVSKTLLHFEDLLTADFFRCHKSYIINLKEIKSYIRGDAGEIMMSNKKVVALSRAKKDAFLGLFGKL